MIKRKFTAMLCLMLACVLLLCSCGSATENRAVYDTVDGEAYTVSTQSAYGTKGKYEVAEPEAENYYSYTADVAAKENGSAVSIDTVLKEQSDRKIIYSSWANVETKEYDKTIASLKSLCEKYKAYFESSDSYGGNIGVSNERRSTFVIRIPVDSYSDFINEVGGIGTVVSSGENNRDVTDQYYDTEARLKSAELREERVLVLLENAGSLDDILALERELSDIRYEIEELTGSLRKFDSLINYATFDLTINEVIEYTKPVIVPLTFGQKVSQSFKSGLDSFIEGWQNLVIALSYNIFNIITFAVVLTVIVIVIVLALRKPKPTKKAQAPSADEKKK